MDWKEEYLQLINGYSNEDLFDEYMSVCKGDGWDGRSSNANNWRIKECWNLLNARLIQCGFFKQIEPPSK